ncbi:S-adenosyl-L-methionine-dependent methyltransferase [Thelonectria olida]|uniref:S-adenosyl-L-methionine-dependent methyltransferase n=1 Tax=Thelonectria olida TaxID=1576542 RepID=A0A9P9ARX4_9HYPO|nr:S-adenosyl-L-methionine-dependent methyltransferase [Thelonectria olida]
MSQSTPPPVANEGNKRFNDEAAAWDNNPFVHAMSLKAWEAMQKFVPSLFSEASRKPDILEIGCGTGLLTLQVAPAANQLVAVDAAEGMIEVLSSKLDGTAPDNITPLAILLLDPEDKNLPAANKANPNGPRLKFDLVISHLVLHHIPDMEQVLTTMLGCLKEGGMVALTDFEDFGPEARRFHPESKMDGVERHGIPREEMAALMEKVGFKDVRVEVAWEHEKLVEKFPGEFDDGKAAKGEGEMMKFSYLICMGKKG